LADHPDLLAGEQINVEEPRRWLLVTREMAVPGEQAGASRWSLRAAGLRFGKFSVFGFQCSVFRVRSIAMAYSSFEDLEVLETSVPPCGFGLSIAGEIQ
jgi:hypothetical protein